MLPWAITRVAADAHRVVDQLTALGLEAFALPCIERHARPIEPWTWHGTRVGFFTSTGAVEATAPALPGLDLGLIAAIAPGTSEALKSLGRKVDVEGTHGAVSLASAVTALLERLQRRKPAFWYPTSDAGARRDEQEQAIRCLEQVGPVTRIIAYETRAPGGLGETVRRLPRAYGVVFSSPSTVEHFVQARPPVGPRKVACWGASTLTAARVHFPTAVELDRTRPLSESLAALERAHA